MAIDWNTASVLGVARLRIRAEKYLDGEQAFLAATLRIKTAAGLWRKLLTLPIGPGAMATIEVPPGDYSLEAVLPSGETISCDGSVKTGEVDEADLIGRPSQHEWLSWASYAMDAGYLQPVSAPGMMEPAFGTGAEATFAQPKLREVWGEKGGIRFWTRDVGLPGNWNPVDLSPVTTDQDEFAFAARFFGNDPTRAMVLAEVFAEEGDSVYSWLPVNWQTTNLQFVESLLLVDLMPGSPRAAIQRPGFRVRTTVKDSNLAQLVGYQRHGEVEALRKLSEEMAPMAEDMLRDKIHNPLLAAAAGLALLNIRQLSRLHDWTFNLADWFPWLPDGAVIRAWHLLYAKGPEFTPLNCRDGLPDEALAWLLEGAHRGLPIYAESLKLLVQGLRAFPTGGDDPAQRDTERALQFYEPLLWETQSRQGFTSVRGPASKPPLTPF